MSRKKLTANSISTFDLNTLYTTIPHKLIKVLSEVINFVFKFKVRKGIGFSKTFIYWTCKGAGRRYFTKQILRINDFLPRAFDLFSRMVTLDGKE